MENQHGNFWNRNLFQETEKGKIAFSIKYIYSKYGIIQVDINTYR